MTRRFDAVIFDMDGVIADSEPVYGAMFNTMMAPLGYHLDEPLLRRLMGHGMRETWEILEQHFSIPNVESVIAEYDAALPGALSQVHETLPGVREVIAAVEARRLPLGLGSSSRRAWIEHDKPAPDIYLRVAELMGVPPARCLVIEDTPAGVASGKGAGMFVVQTRSASSAFQPIDDADLVLGSLADFDLRLLD